MARKKNSKLCVVVIPIHSDCPTPYELISFEQCFKILHQHEIKIIAPLGINLDKYRAIIPVFDVIFIDPNWQSSIENYNKLKLSSYFYHLFNDFDFLLTYELDAFIFKDEVDYWCKKNYDYIGAPWFLGFDQANTNEIIGVGNSGFSLRKIKTMRKAIRALYYVETNNSKLSTKKRFKDVFKKILFFLKFNRKENSTIQNAEYFNEDWFIANVISLQIKNFNIAPIKEAIQFSFEVQPSYLFSLNDFRLPMGCHAWVKYDLEFWKPHIRRFGYSV